MFYRFVLFVISIQRVRLVLQESQMLSLFAVKQKTSSLMCSRTCPGKQKLLASWIRLALDYVSTNNMFTVQHCYGCNAFTPKDCWRLKLDKKDILFCKVPRYKQHHRDIPYPLVFTNWILVPPCTAK